MMRSAPKTVLTGLSLENLHKNFLTIEKATPQSKRHLEPHDASLNADSTLPPTFLNRQVLPGGFHCLPMLGRHINIIVAISMLKDTISTLKTASAMAICFEMDEVGVTYPVGTVPSVAGHQAQPTYATSHIACPERRKPGVLCRSVPIHLREARGQKVA